jgi:hypothetical protein
MMIALADTITVGFAAEGGLLEKSLLTSSKPVNSIS